MLKKTQKSWI